MKKLLCFAVVIICILLTALPAFGVNGQPTDNATSEGYMTWEFLGTMSGATAAVMLIVQFLKAPLDKIWKIPTRYVVYLISLVILFVVEMANGGPFTFERIFLTLLNGIVVTMAAMGAYEITFAKTENQSPSYNRTF